MEPVQTPPWQLSVWVQALPSLHAVPFALLVGEEQVPVEGLHVPGSWHWSAEQTTGLEPVHVPLWQVSVCVQALPSLHAEPSALGGFEQTPVLGLQVPAT